jgi:hypothetical protein
MGWLVELFISSRERLGDALVRQCQRRVLVAIERLNRLTYVCHSMVVPLEQVIIGCGLFAVCTSTALMEGDLRAAIWNYFAVVGSVFMMKYVLKLVFKGPKRVRKGNTGMHSFGLCHYTSTQR